MSIDKNIRVGCASDWYPENGTGRINFGCNYAAANMLNQPIYIDGPVASNCKTGIQTVYDLVVSHQISRNVLK